MKLYVVKNCWKVTSDVVTLNHEQQNIIVGDYVSGLTGVGGEEEDDDGPEQQPQRAGHAPAGESIY